MTRAPRFELDFDLEVALRHLKKDHQLAKLFRRIGPPEIVLRASPNPFEALAESITYQQLHAKAAAAIFFRVKALHGRRAMDPSTLLSMNEDKLRSAGLSHAKILAIRDLAVKAVAGLVPSWSQMRKLDDEEIIERLTQVRGIGRWTVEMLLIFHLGRPDVWPVDDFAIRKAYGLLFDIEKPSAREMQTRAEAWRPYRSVVAATLWRSLETGKQ